MKIFRWFVATFLVAFATTARSTDLSDLWWNTAENGWGANVVQQGDILFLTFFIYGADNQTYWLSGSSTQFMGADASGALVYNGPLSQTSGPWFGAAFNPALVANSQVGSVTFTASTSTSATLTYNVGNTSVTKQLTRLTFRSNPAINGSYYGGIVSDVSGCDVATGNGHSEGQTRISISGISTTLVVIEGTTAACSMSGPYTQDGRMGRIHGSMSCTTGVGGTVELSDIEGNASGMSARFRGTYANGCTESGHFAGVRR